MISPKNLKLSDVETQYSTTQSYCCFVETKNNTVRTRFKIIRHHLHFFSLKRPATTHIIWPKQTKNIVTQSNESRGTVNTRMEELEQLAKLIETGKAKRILVLCGAGVSTGMIARTTKPLIWVGRTVVIADVDEICLFMKMLDGNAISIVLNFWLQSAHTRRIESI